MANLPHFVLFRRILDSSRRLVIVAAGEIFRGFSGSSRNLESAKARDAFLKSASDLDGILDASMTAGIFNLTESASCDRAVDVA